LAAGGNAVVAAVLEPAIQAKDNKQGSSGWLDSAAGADLSNKEAEFHDTAHEARWLKIGKSGKVLRNRERQELESKLDRLNLSVPWDQ